MFEKCILEINQHKMPVDLVPMTLGDFDVIVGMDWLGRHQAQIICDKQLLEVKTLDGEVITINGARGN